MGAKQCRPPAKPIKKHVCIREATELKLKTSPTTLFTSSLMTIPEGVIVDMNQTPSQTFDDAFMEKMLQHYTPDEQTGRDGISEQLVRDIMVVMESLTLDQHVLSISTQFTPMYLSNDSIRTAFRESDKPSIFTKIEHKITMHTMCLMRLHRIFLTTFEDGKHDKVYELLNYVALRHLILNVHPRLFREHLVLTIKNLLHFNLITEEQLPHYVYYNMLLIDRICKTMDEYSLAHRLAYEIDLNSGVQTTCRKYYRELKKWKAFLVNIRKSLAKPIAAFEKLVEESERSAVQTEGASDVNWKCTRFLKKGYKFKEYTG